LIAFLKSWLYIPPESLVHTTDKAFSREWVEAIIKGKCGLFQDLTSQRRLGDDESQRNQLYDLMIT
jgi:hypothetical protein